MSRALSYTMRHELRKIVAAGEEGLAYSNTNRTADGLHGRGMIEQIEGTRNDRVCLRWRWRATDAGRAEINGKGGQ